MRSRELLPFCAASAVARGSIANNVGIGICRSPALTSNELFPDLAVCSRDGIVSAYDGVKPGGWTYSSPCFRNGTTEYCVYASQSFADSRGISIITHPRRAAKIARQPAFTQPENVAGLNQDIVQDEAHVYKVVPMPGKGMGVIATKPLNRGDHIMSNTASMMIDYGAFENVPEGDVARLQAAGVDYLSPEHRSRLMTLSTHDQADLSRHKLIEKILATNSFDIDNDDGEDYNFYVVFPESELSPAPGSL